MNFIYLLSPFIRFPLAMKRPSMSNEKHRVIIYCSLANVAIYPYSRLFSPFLQTISKNFKHNFKQRQTHGRSMKFNYSAHERNSTSILQSDVAKNRFAEYHESEELRFKLCSSRENIREKPIACIRCTLHHRYT